MGQKANPIVLRLGINRDCDSTWFSTAIYAELLLEDVKIRKYLNKELMRAGISKINIRRRAEAVEVDVYAARPGTISGKGGDTTYLKEELEKDSKKKFVINIVEEKSPESNPKLLGEFVAGQLEKRIPFRRAMKMAVQRALRAGAQGVMIYCAGRLGGAEIARTEWYREGKIPRHTFRADVDYAFTEAFTTYGKIGVKVLVYNGEVTRLTFQQEKNKREAVAVS